MHRYLVTGHAEIIRGWKLARTVAELDARRTGEIVTVTDINRRGDVRHTCTVFPDGKVVRTPDLHRQPPGFGL